MTFCDCVVCTTLQHIRIALVVWKMDARGQGRAGGGGGGGVSLGLDTTWEAA
jgi:hypothetical protein